MLIRIVKMGFAPENIDTFLNNFEENKLKIRGFEGCEFLELYRGKDNINQFFTYSYWKDEAALENYRHSDLFKDVWAKTKILFNEKPEAWSVDKIWRSEK
ncbi:putative quinol monooxygenase [Autumnicola musiva]|uniref:Antibiotic biosynthesis monooxygenase family protein n=1 Tax=Autumnicola musiva TaxID=3075589 RepID=A0ABU3DBI6_9FLAO|nr:antibiotic biosynthesis monooxygenase family protein [Zunongwangia sp. F117]MDT0678739.1 antibiotic biosynthesis monooxygenase family protein [Zunongwangia sp. F117]